MISVLLEHVAKKYIFHMTKYLLTILSFCQCFESAISFVEVCLFRTGLPGPAKRSQYIRVGKERASPKPVWAYRAEEAAE